MNEKKKKHKSKKKLGKAPITIPTIIVDSPSASSSSLTSETLAIGKNVSLGNSGNENSACKQNNSEIPEESDNGEDVYEIDKLPETADRRSSLRRNSISLPNLEDLELEMLKNYAQNAAAQQVCFFI